MPSPKSGNAGSAVKPADPAAALEADQADPGEVEKIKAEQLQTQSGKYGSTPVTPHKPPQTKEEKKKKKSWIEIKLVDLEGLPVPGEKYKITLPDDSVAEGTLNEKGFARVEGFDPGSCKVTFPTRDKTTWNPK
jgi:type VI secretion system secreted protein VgrG